MKKLSDAKYNLEIIEIRIRELKRIEFFLENNIDYPDDKVKEDVKKCVEFLDQILSIEAGCLEEFINSQKGE